MSTSLSCTVSARAALAGNPSDGHGGAVVATVVPALAATVSFESDTHFGFTGSTARFASITDVAEWVERGDFEGDQPLMQAALTVLHRRLDADLSPHDLRFVTTIPRSLGLAGSSAIVTATILAMIGSHQDDLWAHELVDRFELIPSLALEAERDVLGITAGLQDRVVQIFDGTVAMEFGPDHLRTDHGLDIGSYRRLGPLPDGMFVAYRDGTSQDSGLVHGSAATDSAAFQQAMERAATAARAAADAIDRGDALALGRAMDATFDERAMAFDLDPAHVEMIEVARDAGASANYTGSGGSIVVLAPDNRAADALRRIGCTIVAL